MNTQTAIDELELHLQVLKEKYEFCESLKPSKSSCGLDWRLVVARERFRIKKAHHANIVLKKRVSDNAQLIQRISRHMDRQGMKAMPISVQEASQISGLDDEAHVRRVLQACLDFRCLSQVDSIVNQCNAIATSLETNDWNTFALENHGIGVRYRESVVIPSSAAYISTISCWPTVDEIQTSESLQSTCLGPKLALHRLVQVRSRTIMLWEDAFCWHKDRKSSRAVVRGSGWVSIAPVSGHQHELSIVYSGGFVLIHTTDRSHLQATDEVVESIVAYAQAEQRARIRDLEDALIDALRQRKDL